MATATKQTRTVTEVTGVTLELTLEEAQALRAVLGGLRADPPLYSTFLALAAADVDQGEFRASRATDGYRGVTGVKREGKED